MLTVTSELNQHMQRSRVSFRPARNRKRGFMTKKSKQEAQRLIVEWKKQGGSLVLLRNMIAEILEPNVKDPVYLALTVVSSPIRESMDPVSAARVRSFLEKSEK